VSRRQVRTHKRGEGERPAHCRQVPALLVENKTLFFLRKILEYREGSDAVGSLVSSESGEAMGNNTDDEVRTTDLTEAVFFALSRRESVPARAGLRMSVSGSFCEEWISSTVTRQRSDWCVQLRM
jgi:hypothetical protein